MTITTLQFGSVNVGSQPNDGTGDDLRNAFIKLNQNFSNISTVGFNAGNILASGEIDITGNLSVSTITTASGNLTLDPSGAATVNVIGDLNIYGNVTRQGGQIDAAYQYYAPTANTAITANINVSRVILDPTSDALGIKFTLPTGNVDAKIITLSSTANIAGLQPIGSLGTTVVPSVNVAIPKGTQIQFFYHAVEGKWYKIG
jgi:hypothetical protein